MHLEWPIIRTASAALGCFFLIVLIHADTLAAVEPSPHLAGWLLLGIIYTQFFEYWSHRFPMHRSMRFLESTRRHHLEHHRVFYGENFQIRGGPDLDHISGRFWVFPVLFLIHYVVLALLLPVSALVVFMLGAVLHYLTFEMTHWLTHIEDNAFDQFIMRVPLIGKLRAYQIEHHRIHHEFPEVAFNFNPPYLGDRLFGDMPQGDEIVSTPPVSETIPETPVAAAIQELPPAWHRPLVRYGSLAAMGVVLVGAVALAHGLWSNGRQTTPAERTV